MSSPKFVTFHNPMQHPTLDKEGMPGPSKAAVAVKFKIPTHETGTFYEYEIEPGEEMQIAEEMAYAVKIYAPQMVEGPAPKKAAAK